MSEKIRTQHLERKAILYVRQSSPYQGWLVKFVEHRVADRRVVRLIQKWLKAGVLEEGKRVQSEIGTVQGGSISPLLSNIYLHHVLDLWVQRWRRKQARGEVIFVRFADDFVAGFQHRHEAERFLAELRERFAQFGLQLHADKTRIVEFGRYAENNRRNRGDGTPETFNFLGFTHSCGKTREGILHGVATDDATEVASQAEGPERGTAATHAHAHPGTGSVLALGPAGPLPLLRGAHEWACAVRVSSGSGLPVADGSAPS
jgi:hypothetical protein